MFGSRARAWKRQYAQNFCSGCVSLSLMSITKQLTHLYEEKSLSSGRNDETTFARKSKISKNLKDISYAFFFVNIAYPTVNIY